MAHQNNKEQPKLRYDWNLKGQQQGGHHQMKMNSKNFEAHRAAPIGYAKPPGQQIWVNDIQKVRILILINIKQLRFYFTSSSLALFISHSSACFFYLIVLIILILQDRNLGTPTKAPESIKTRNSRVMSTYKEDKSKAFRQVITKREYARMMNKNDRFLVKFN